MCSHVNINRHVVMLTETDVWSCFDLPAESIMLGFDVASDVTEFIFIIMVETVEATGE